MSGSPNSIQDISRNNKTTNRSKSSQRDTSNQRKISRKRKKSPESLPQSKIIALEMNENGKPITIDELRALLDAQTSNIQKSV